MIKVFGYHCGNNGVSMYRVWQPLEALDKEEFRVRRVPNRSERINWQGLTGPSNVPTIGSHAEIIEKNDIIFSCFRANEDDCARLTITSKLKKLVVDIDDDVMHLPSDNLNYKFWFSEENGRDYWGEIPEDEIDNPKWEKMEAAGEGQLLTHPKTGKLCFVMVKRHPVEMVIDEIKAAHLVTVSTPRLKDVYGQYNKNMIVVSNAIDFSKYPTLITPRKDGIIRLGLFGSNSHYRDWKVISKPLHNILKEFPNVHLCFNTWFKAKGSQGASMDEQELTPVVPDFFDDLMNHPQVEPFAGVELDYYHDWLADKQVDIGLAPLCDSEFNLAKSNIKYLEFSALHVPGVYQDYEPYKHDIRQGANGYLAKDSLQWERCLRTLILDATLRQKMGDRAHADVKARYDVKNVARKLGHALKKLMAVPVEA